jgi:lipopolysaccharide/colanic/teichoic acid biosynthesis glycosyltransferase
MASMLPSVGQLETLKIMPGLTSPGSLFDYIYGDVLLAGDDAEKAYVDKLLPIKLELDAYYMRHKSLAYDLKIIFKTVELILKATLKRKPFARRQ